MAHVVAVRGEAWVPTTSCQLQLKAETEKNEQNIAGALSAASDMVGIIQRGYGELGEHDRAGNCERLWPPPNLQQGGRPWPLIPSFTDQEDKNTRNRQQSPSCI